MVQLKHLIPLILLLPTPPPVVGNGAFISFVESTWMALDAARQQSLTLLDLASVQNDHQIQELHNRFGNLEEKIDQNFNNLMQRVDELLSKFSVSQDSKKLSDNYREMKKSSNILIKWQRRVNNNFTIPKDLLPSIQTIQSSWSETRALVTSEPFFTRLSSNWRGHYGLPWQGPCYTYMSDSQVRYTLFLEYMDFAKNYFIAGYLFYSIRRSLGDDIGWLTNDFVSSVQEDLDADFEYFERVIKSSSREFWSCDQDKASKESWYHELEAFTTYYTVRQNIQPPCHHSCTNVSVTSCLANSIIDDGLCMKTRKCNGPLLSCTLSNHVNMCVKDSYTISDESTYRRYITVDREIDYSGRDCTLSIATLRYSSELDHAAVQLKPKQRYERLNYHNCLCRENQYYISTFPVTASPGFVVVGVQLKFRNRTLYIDIYEGKRLSDETIANETFATEFLGEPEWLEYRIPLNPDSEIDLGPTMLPEKQNRVVTGVQLVQTGNRIHLALHSKAINMTTGTFVSKSAQITQKTSFGTEELKLEKVDRSDKADRENLPYSNNNQYVKFTVTGLWEDGGQTTVPFVDTQLALPDPLIPLSGISFYIRGQEKFGGFLALKTYTHDHTAHMKKGMRLVEGIRKMENLRKCIR